MKNKQKNVTIKTKGSITKKTLTILIPVLILSFLLLSTLSFYTSKNLLKTQINNRLNSEINSILNNIRVKLNNQGKVAQTIAQNISINNNEYSKDYNTLLEKCIKLDDNTFATGIWFDKYKFNSKIDKFALYSYRNNDKIETTDCNKYYANYLNEWWFLEGKQVSKNTVGWTKAYIDKITNTALVTVSAPFTDKNEQLKGIVTLDVNIDNIIKMIQDAKIGNTGRVFLISKDGEYISDTDKNKIMKVNIKNDTNQKLRNLSKQILNNQQGEAHFKDIDGKSRLLFRTIPETGWKIGIVMPEKEVSAPLNTLLLELSITTIIALIIIIFFIILGIKYLIKNVNKANEFSQIMAQGNFMNKVEINSNDEIGNMMNNLNIMAEQLKNIIISVRKNINEVVYSSQQLSSISEENLSMVENVSNSTQNVAESTNKLNELFNNSTEIVNEVNQGMKQISNSVETVSSSTDQASTLANDGNKVIKMAIKQMNNIDNAVNYSSNIIDTLGIKSNEVGNILTIIESISEQTNLLALNASIEAARAGEAGRGFAVVADEIRKLAEGTKNSTLQISNIIKEIQNEINKAVVSMSQANEKVKDGITIADKAGISFNNIYGAVDNVSKDINQISSVIEEIYAGMETMVASIENMSTIVKNTTEQTHNIAAAAEQEKASMEEVAKSAEILSEIALTLENEFSVFKVK